MNFLCYDIGGIDIKMGIVTEEAVIINKKTFPTEPLRTPKQIISDMLFRADKLLEESGLSLGDISAIGIGVPGLADNNTGNVIFCPNIFWRDVPLRAYIKAQFDVPVFIANDATLAAIAEHSYGACKGAKNSVTLTIGTGLGSGIVIDDKIYEGRFGGGGEIGHMVIEQGGKLCNCGNQGCFEVYASVPALLQAAQAAAEKHPDSMLKARIASSPLTGKDVIDCAKAGDPAAVSVFDAYTDYLNLGITNIINIFDPDMIAIGGGLTKAGDFLLHRIENTANRKREYSMLPPVKIVLAAFSNDAGMIGAALLCLQKLQK